MMVSVVASGCGKKQGESPKGNSKTALAEGNTRAQATDAKASKQEQPVELFPVFVQTQFGWSDARYGYIDRKGSIIIRPSLQYGSSFSEGLAVALAENLSSQYGYIDHTGTFAIRPQFDRAHPFSGGLAAVLVGDRWGFIDRAGAFVIRPQFNHEKSRVVSGLPQGAGDFSDGLAPVLVEKKWGYVDRSGTLAIEPKFERADLFAEGLAAVLLSRRWGYISKTGELVIPCEFGNEIETNAIYQSSGVGRFSGGLAPVKTDAGKWGYIDRLGRLVIHPAFEYAGAFSEGLAPVRFDKKWGYIDTTGKVVISPSFDDAEPFSEGLAKVGIESTAPSLETVRGVPWTLTANIRNLYGYIDRPGRTVIEPKFEHAGSFQHGLAWVHTGQSSQTQIRAEGYIDKMGTLVWTPGNKVEVEVSGNDKLLRQLRSIDLRQHFDAAVALAKVGKPVVPDLIKLLHDESWYVQVTAMWVLGKIRDEQATEPLIRMLRSEERVGPSAYTSYIGDMSYEAQRELSIYQSPRGFPSWNILFHRRVAAIALASIGDKRAVGPLKELLEGAPFSDGAEANVAVARALKKLSGGTLPENIESELRHWGMVYK